MARVAGRNEAGEASISQFPQAHGDHFHLGDAVVAGKDATGLYNEAVWNALARKGLARSDYPRQIVLTAEGLGYDTGLADEILALWLDTAFEGGRHQRRIDQITEADRSRA